jgi:hypothetical protein
MEGYVILLCIVLGFLAPTLRDFFTRLNTRPLAPNTPPLDLFGNARAKSLSAKVDIVGRKIISDLLPSHFETLIRKRRNLIYEDDYGSKNDTQWLRELGYFYETLILPRLRAEFTHSGDWEDFSRGTKPEDVKRAFVECLNETLAAAMVDMTDTINVPEDGHAYERYCCDVLRDAGWEARRNPASGDQGADVIAENGRTRAVIQCGSFGSRPRLSRSAAIRSSTRTTRGRSKLTNSVSPSVSSRRFTITFSPRSSRCSQSTQRRNASTSLDKRDPILVSRLGRSASFFGA